MPGITNPTEGYFKDGTWGWDGTQWRKLNLVWGYYDRLIERQYNLSAAAGANTLTFTAVPAGEVWVYTTVTAVDANTGPTSIIVNIVSGGITYIAMAWLSPGANGYRQISGQFILKAADYLTITISGCALNDDLWAWATGYKMKVS